MQFKARKMFLGPPVLELSLFLIVAVKGAPPLLQISRRSLPPSNPIAAAAAVLNQANDVNGGNQNGPMQSKPSLDAEHQLELLKLNSTEKASSTPPASSSTSKPKLGKLNLETPAVSDNSRPEQAPFSIPGEPISISSPVIELEEIKKKKTGYQPSRAEGASLSLPLLGQRIGQSQSGNNNLKIQTDYTPQDIAEYIFWTGDDRGVVDALNDFLQEDLVRKEDVIKFLEDVRVELKLLGNRFDSVVTKSQQGQQQQQQFLTIPDGKFRGPLEMGMGMGKGNTYELFGSSQSKNPGAGAGADYGWRDKRIFHENSNGPTTKDEEADYDELVQTMNAMNMKVREDSLREIIYRLSREVFSERFGDHAIQRFVRFVEEATSSGHIPKDLERQILDTMVTALVDALFEKDMNHRKGEGVAIPIQSDLQFRSANR